MGTLGIRFPITLSLEKVARASRANSGASDSVTGSNSDFMISTYNGADEFLLEFFMLSRFSWLI